MKKTVMLSLLLLLISCAPVQQPPITTPQQPIIQQETTPPQPIPTPQPTISNLTVTFIDVGQGDSILVTFPNKKTMLVDCGEKSEPVLNQIRKQNIQQIDILLITHPDSDHIGGCADVIRNTPVTTFIENGQGKNTQTYQNVLTLAKTKNYKTLTTDQHSYPLDTNTKLDFLVPYDTWQGYDTKVNENSITTKITYGDISFLLMGDCETKCEQTLAQTENLQANIIKIGHHGSTSSTTDTLLTSVKPRTAVISVGADNTYGHPDSSILFELQNKGVETHRTDLEGSITITTNGKTYDVITSKTATIPTPIITPPVTQTTTSSGHLWYTSSYATSKYYYCDTDTQWKTLSPKYLKVFNSKEDLLRAYPTRTLHKPC